jgi:hypothetical protein
MPDIEQSKLFTGQEVRIPITDPKMRAEVAELLGARFALEVLRSLKWAQELAGMRVAQAALEREAALTQLSLHRRITPIMAQAGVDLTSWHAAMFEGVEKIVCRPIAEIPADMREGEDGS